MKTIILTWSLLAFGVDCLPAQIINNGLNKTDIASGTITPMSGDLDIPGVALGHRINATPHTLTRMLAYGTGGGGSGSAPIRIMRWGDSFSSGMEPPDNAALSGRFDTLPAGTTGTVTTNTAENSRWINRVTYQFATGSTGMMSPGGSTSTWMRGDRAAIAYIKRPAGATFEVRYESSLATGTWTLLGTINSYNATEAGGYDVFTLPTTNAPFFRIRVENVTTGSATTTPASALIVTAGVYCSDGGGIIWMPQTAAVGLSPSDLTIPDAVFNPIWTGLAPDVVVTAWLDYPSEFETGGGFKTLYDRSKVQKSNTDWILVGPHYLQDSAQDAATDAQVVAMRNIAINNNESFFDSRPLFSPYSASLALGLTSNDGMHLTTAGSRLRDMHLWHTMVLGRYPLGLTNNSLNGEVPIIRMGDEPGTAAAKSATVPRDLIVRGNNGISVFDMANPTLPTRVGRFRAITSSDPHALAEAQFGTGANYPLRVGEQVTKIHSGGFALPPAATVTSTASIFRSTPPILCDATSGNQTMNISHSASDSPGRIHIFKKIDSTANTVTIDPSGSETIDGATTYVMTAQWQTVVIQTNGTNWFIISKF